MWWNGRERADSKSTGLESGDRSEDLKPFLSILSIVIPDYCNIIGIEILFKGFDTDARKLSHYQIIFLGDFLFCQFHISTGIYHFTMFSPKGRLLQGCVVALTSLSFMQIGYDNGLMGGLGQDTGRLIKISRTRLTISA